LASSLLILYHELVILQFFFYSEVCLYVFGCFTVVHHYSIYKQILLVLSVLLTFLEHYLMAPTFVLYYVTCGPLKLYQPKFWLGTFCRYLTPPASVIHSNSFIGYFPPFHNFKMPSNLDWFHSYQWSTQQLLKLLLCHSVVRPMEFFTLFILFPCMLELII
jgi:hypothetical protein